MKPGRVEEVGRVSCFALPAFRAERSLRMRVPAVPKIVGSVCNSAIDTDSDRSIILKHRKADLGYASVPFMAKGFDQL